MGPRSRGARGSRPPRSQRRLAPGAAALLAVLLTGCIAPPRPFELTARVDLTGPAPRPFLAGAATVPFGPLDGYPLGGYGGGARRAEWPFYLGVGWPGRLALWCHQAWHEDEPDGRADLLSEAEGAHEEVGARALVLRPEGGAPLAIVRIDTIGTTAELHEAVVARLTDLGYGPGTVLLAATHTHSGPGAFFRPAFARLAAMDNFRPELEAQLADACAAAVRAAHAAARPARLGLARAFDRGPTGAPVIGKNRRAGRFDADDLGPHDIDPEIGLLLVTERDGPRPIALVVNYAVHCTVLGSDSLHFSRDLAGGIEDALGARLGGAPVLFLNGAEGDIRPSRVRAAGGQLRCRELGEALAALVEPALQDLPLHGEIRLRAAIGGKELGTPRTVVALGRARFLDGDAGVGGWLTAPLMLPVNAVLWTLGATNLRLGLSWNGGLGAVLYLDGLIDRTRTRVGGLRLEAGDEDVALLCVPGEPTHDVGLALREEAARRGATRTFVVGLALDHVGYIASRKEYRRGSYEAWSTLFGEETADEVLEAERGVLDALGYGEGEARPASAAPVPAEAATADGRPE